MDLPGSITVLIVKHDGQQVKINIHPTQTISQLKQKIQERDGTPSDRQILTFCGQRLHIPEKTLQDLNIKNDSLNNSCSEDSRIIGSQP